MVQENQKESLCPLCFNCKGECLFEDNTRPYFNCENCNLIFVPASFHLSPEEEFRRYQTHENNPDDPKYREFLGRLTDPLLQRIQPTWKGLDFGSGPGPTISVIFEEKGISVRNFDPFFDPDRELLNQNFDFITCTETAEHFRRPAQEFRLLNKLLKPGGVLGVMTENIENKESFPDWYYRRDPTHIAFYSSFTQKWIASHFGWKVEFPRRNVALFFKPLA